METVFNNQTFIITNVAGIDMADYGDFCDAYIEEAEYPDGTPVGDDILDAMNDNGGFVSVTVFEWIQ